MTQIAHQYSTKMAVPYAEAYDHIKNLWDTSGSVQQFLTNLADIKYTNQYGTSLPAIEDVAGALMYYKQMGNGALKGINEQARERQEAYHNYIRQLHYVLGTPYTLILEDSLYNMSQLNVDNLKPVVFEYAVDPNMMAEHTPSEEELRTYTNRHYGTHRREV
jgi:hypothetical protein